MCLSGGLIKAFEINPKDPIPDCPLNSVWLFLKKELMDGDVGWLFLMTKKMGGSEEWKYDSEILQKGLEDGGMVVFKSFIEICWWNYFWNPSYHPSTGEWGQIFKSLSQVIDAAAKTVGHVAAQWWSRCSACWDWNKMKQATIWKSSEVYFLRIISLILVGFGVVFSHLWEKTSWNFH